MNTDFYFGVALGMILGIVISLAIILWPGNLVSRANDAIQKCEQSLPRDQSCELIGVPK